MAAGPRGNRNGRWRKTRRKAGEDEHGQIILQKPQKFRHRSTKPKARTQQRTQGRTRQPGSHPPPEGYEKLYSDNVVRHSRNLDREIVDFVNILRLSEEERQFRQVVFDDLKSVILSVSPEAEVKLYGSSANGLETFRSDLDVTVSDFIPFFNPSTSSTPEEVACAPDIGTTTLIPSASDSDEGQSPTFSINVLCDNSSSDEDTEPKTSKLKRKRQSTWNRQARAEKLRVLGMLQHVIKAFRPNLKIKCLRRARVPILMISDSSSPLCIDIGLNDNDFDDCDHGRTTNLMTKLQDLFGSTFQLLIGFLKEFLHQYDLNHPFTGGIGSFRLYVMVARILLQREANDDRLSDSLLAFFCMYGNMEVPNFLNKETRIVLEVGEVEVDFKSVFRLDECIEMFASAYQILTKKKCLGSIIYEEKIHEERARHHRLTKSALHSQLQSIEKALNEGGTPTQSGKSP